MCVVDVEPSDADPEASTLVPAVDAQPVTTDARTDAARDASDAGNRDASDAGKSDAGKSDASDAGRSDASDASRTDSSVRDARATDSSGSGG